MEVQTVKLFWFQIPVTFRGVPDELRVQVKRLAGGSGCCCWLARRRYRTSLRVRLETHQWHVENGHLKYDFAPPLVFSVFHEDFRLKVTVQDLKTRASRTYKIGSGAASHVADICLFILPEESSENNLVSEEVPSSPSETYFSALEELEVSQDASGFSKDSTSHLEQPSCGKQNSVVHVENTVLRDGLLNLSTPANVSEDPVKILASPSSNKKGFRRRTVKRDRSRVPFPTT